MKHTKQDLAIDWRDLIGFERHLAKLQDLQKSSRLPQALLFTGREGIGKRKFVAKLMGLFYCETESACGQCQPCQDLLRGEHEELLFMEQEKSYKIDDAQELQDHLSVQSGSIRRSGELQRLPDRCDARCG